jgi:double-stranded uracil-DNA glycosylase
VSAYHGSMTGRRPLQHHRAVPPTDPFLPPDLTLPDLLAPGLDLVFVGINPSIYSAERGQYFARPSNMFWRCLNRSGLVPEPLGPADSHRLRDFGIGLTDIVKRATHDAAELTAAEFRVGRDQLRTKLLDHQPRAVCFVGKLAYQHYSGRRTLPFGLQAESIGDSAVFVMPSTSGLVNNLQPERLRCLAEVREFLGR